MTGVDNTEWILGDDVWSCLLSLIATYFSKKALDVFVPNSIVDISPLFLNDSRTLYVNSRDLHGRHHVDVAKVDAVFFVKSWSMEDVDLYGTYDRVAVVTDEEKIALPLWIRSRLANTVVIVPHKTHVAAYTWFPYHPHNCHRPVHLEWLANCSALTTWSTNLYPSKVPAAFNGCPVVFMVWPWPPDIHYNAIKKTYGGREVSMMNVLATSLDLSPVYVQSDLSNVQFFNYSLDIGTAMGSIRSGQIDFAFATMSLLPYYNMVSEPLPVYRDQPIVWMFPRAKTKDGKTGLYSGFPARVWTTILAVLVCSGLLVFCLLTVEASPATHFNWMDYIALLVASPISTRNNYSSSVRLFHFLLQVYSLHIAWFYQSTLLLNLFKTPTDREVTSVEEAVDAGLHPYIYGYMVDLYFSDGNYEGWRRILRPGAYTDMYHTPKERLVKEKSCFLLGNLVNTGYELRNTYGAPLGSMVNVQVLLNNPVAAYGYRGSPLTKKMRTRMIRFIDSGIMWHLTSMERGYLDEPQLKVNPGPKVLKVKRLHMAFILHGFVFLLATFVFILECAAARWGYMCSSFFNPHGIRQTVVLRSRRILFYKRYNIPILENNK